MTVVSRSQSRLRIATHSGGVVHGWAPRVHGSGEAGRAAQESARGQERPHPQGTPRHSPAGWHIPLVWPRQWRRAGQPLATRIPEATRADRPVEEATRGPADNRSERLHNPRPGREARRTAGRSPETDTLIPHHRTKTPVSLGGKKAFLVSASLDGGKLPILETVEDGFAAAIETPGEHALTLDLEVPVTSHGAKPELGFEIGLPRAAITTLLLEPPDPAIKRVNLTTRTSDPTQPMRPPEPRRVPALDVKQFASRPGQETGTHSGRWNWSRLHGSRPASSALPADRVQSAELDLAVLLTEGAVETTARIKLHGPAREWKVVAPAIATLSVNRAVGVTDIGPAQAPTVTKPASAAKPVWTIVFPAGSTPS